MNSERGSSRPDPKPTFSCPRSGHSARLAFYATELLEAAVGEITLPARSRHRVDEICFEMNGRNRLLKPTVGPAQNLCPGQLVT